jgi:hypothetical protein
VDPCEFGKRENEYKPLKFRASIRKDNLSCGTRVEDILSQNQGMERKKLAFGGNKLTENPRSFGPLTSFSAAG